MAKNRNKPPVDRRIIIVVALTAVMLLILAVLILSDPAVMGSHEDTQPGQTTGQTQPGQTDPAQTSPDTDPADTGSHTGTEPGHVATNPTEPSQPQNQATEPTSPGTATTPTQPVEVPEVPVGENSYEEHLAAAMVVGASMEYLDFQVLGIYAPSRTPVSAKLYSQGAYAHLVIGGQEVLIRSLPLEGKRSEPGTTDLYTADLGYATFEVVEPSSVDLSGMEELTLEELSDLIAQSMLVSLYAN